MKKIIYLFLALIIFTNSSLAVAINGGVIYTVKSARDYLKDGQTNSIQISGPTSFKKDNSIKKVVYSYGNDGSVIGVTVQYKGEPDMAYIYGRDYNLKYVDKYDRNVDLYPHRGYRYDLNGRLILTSLTVSKNEQFRFTPAGDLLAHSVKGVIFDENGNVMGTASGR